MVYNRSYTLTEHKEIGTKISDILRQIKSANKIQVDIFTVSGLVNGKPFPPVANVGIDFYDNDGFDQDLVETIIAVVLRETTHLDLKYEHIKLCDTKNIFYIDKQTKKLIPMDLGQVEAGIKGGYTDATDE